MQSAKTKRVLLGWLPAILGIFCVLPALLFASGLILRVATEDKLQSPAPIEIIRSVPALLELNFEGRVYAGEALSNTVGRVLIATGLSAIVGVLFAFALSWRSWLWGVSQPTVDLLRSVPVTFFVPIIALRTGSSAQYLPWLLAAIPCSLIMLFQVRQGIEDIDKARIHSFYLLAGSKKSLSCLWHVIIPEIMPEFIGGLRLGCSYAIVIVSVLEFFSVGSREIGFGLLIANQAQNSVNDPRIVAGILVFGLFGLVLNKGLEMIEGYVTRWKSDDAQV